MKIKSKKSILDRSNLEVVSVQNRVITNAEEIRNIHELPYRQYSDLISKVEIHEITYSNRGDPAFGDDPEFDKITEVVSFEIKNLRLINGYYHYRKMVKGKPLQFSLKVKSIEDALKRINEIISLIQRDKAHLLIEKMRNRTEKEETNRPKQKSVADLFNDYIRVCEMEGKSVRTIGLKKQMKNQLEILKVRSIKQFDQETIIRIEEYWKKKYAYNSIIKYRSELTAFLNYLISQGVYKRDDYEKLKFGKGKVKAKELIIRPDDLKIIFDNLKENDKDFYLYVSTLFYTISRPGEIPKMQVKDINFYEEKVTIYTSKTARLGKDRKIIPLFPELSALLAEHIGNNSLQKNDYLFKGATSPNDNYYGKKFSKLKEILKINQEYTLYTYRHTAETTLYNLTKDAELISRMAGHDVSMALGVYVNYDIDKLKEQIKGVKLL